MSNVLLLYAYNSVNNIIKIRNTLEILYDDSN